MLSATMRSAVTQALRSCAGGLPAKSLPSRVALVRRSFLVAPSYKSRVAVRGFATATASKTTGRTAAKPATKTKAKAKAKATTTKAKKTAKAPAKKKKAAPKPKKPVVKKKKELTPEQKELLLKRELRQKSLINREPKQLPTTRWVLLVSRSLKGKTPGGLGEQQRKMVALSAEYKALSPAQLEEMDETILQNKATNAGNFKTWVESHSVGEIQQANKARKRLKRSFNVNPYPLKIVDGRLPKRPATSGYAYFVKARRTPDSPLGLTKELSEEWNTMPATEKKPYLDLAHAEYARFTKEMEKLQI